LVGYRRVFPSLTAAEAYAARFLSARHEHADSIATHQAFSGRARPSDYPALFYLQSILPDIKTVFDLGGNVGNVFYCYQNYISFSLDLIWTVFDIPAVIPLGLEEARRRNERRLRYADRLGEADAADLFLASGALHYFDVPLSDMLKGLPSRPKHLLINRTPVTNNADVVTVQDAGTYLAPCKLLSRKRLVEELNKLGYELVDSWLVYELGLQIPCYPDLSVPQYSGFYFKLKTLAQKI